MLEAKVIRLEPPKPEKSELRKVYEKRHEEKVNRIISKTDQDIEYYNNRMDALIKETLEQIHSDMLPEDITPILLAGDKKWRQLCANARKLKKYVSLDADAFEKQITTVVFKADEITEAKDKYETNIRRAYSNPFLRIYYYIKRFLKF